MCLIQIYKYRHTNWAVNERRESQSTEEEQLDEYEDGEEEDEGDEFILEGQDKYQMEWR